jgi:hypothetical protein
MTLRSLVVVAAVVLATACAPIEDRALPTTEDVAAYSCAALNGWRTVDISDDAAYRSASDELRSALAATRDVKDERLRAVHGYLRHDADESRALVETGGDLGALDSGSRGHDLLVAAAHACHELGHPALRRGLFADTGLIDYALRTASAPVLPTHRAVTVPPPEPVEETPSVEELGYFSGWYDACNEVYQGEVLFGPHGESSTADDCISAHSFMPGATSRDAEERGRRDALMFIFEAYGSPICSERDRCAYSGDYG